MTGKKSASQATKKRKSKTVGADIIERLTEFVNVLESKESIQEHFTCHHVSSESAMMGPEDIKRIRRLLRVRQARFAQFLGVAPNTLREWEQGTSAPNDMACRLLGKIGRDPAYWAKRLSEVAVEK